MQLGKKVDKSFTDNNIKIWIKIRFRDKRRISFEATVDYWSHSGYRHVGTGGGGGRWASARL